MTHGDEDRPKQLAAAQVEHRGSVAARVTVTNSGISLDRPLPDPCFDPNFLVLIAGFLLQSGRGLLLLGGSQLPRCEQVCPCSLTLKLTLL